MPTQVDSAVTEIQAALDVIRPQLEGMRDFSRLNLEHASGVVQQAITDFNRRDNLLEDALRALTALLSDGYPVMPTREVEQADFVDLKNQVDTITAAFAKFAAIKAADLGMQAGEPSFKE